METTITKELADQERWLTPPQQAAKWGISADKVLEFIRRGELRAVDFSENRGRRPRYRIDPAEAERFLARRSTAPPLKATRQKAKPSHVRQYV